MIKMVFVEMLINYIGFWFISNKIIVVIGVIVLMFFGVIIVI